MRHTSVLASHSRGAQFPACARRCRTDRSDDSTQCLPPWRRTAASTAVVLLFVDINRRMLCPCLNSPPPGPMVGMVLVLKSVVVGDVVGDVVVGDSALGVVVGPRVLGIIRGHARCETARRSTAWPAARAAPRMQAPPKRDMPPCTRWAGLGGDKSAGVFGMESKTEETACETEGRPRGQTAKLAGMSKQ